ncbi:MAG: radical SAM protein [Thermodesulfobacteriota bacterium]|nr:radical SAM protein [Thermodesulfobacteriota bacterium]
MHKQTVSFSKNATNVFFHILTQCNLNCSHCYINPDQHGHERLSIERIKAWLDVLSNRRKNANVIFLGGEPTLHPDLPAVVNHARKAGYQSVTIDTNGYLFNDILDKITPESVDYFSFSLDGATREINDAIRGKGSYDACLTGLEKAVSKGFNASMIYTVSTANIHELDRMADLVAGLGIDRLFIQVLGIRGRSAQDDTNEKGAQVTRQQWLDLVPKAAEKIAVHGITVTYPKVFLSPDEPFECAARVADNYFVFPNGRVYRCPLCEDFAIHSLAFENDQLMQMSKLTEEDFFRLDIPEGCVMNKLVQPDNLQYDADGRPVYQIACCMLKEEVSMGS